MHSCIPPVSLHTPHGCVHLPFSWRQTTPIFKPTWSIHCPDKCRQLWHSYTLVVDWFLACGPVPLLIDRLLLVCSPWGPLPKDDYPSYLVGPGFYFFLAQILSGNLSLMPFLIWCYGDMPCCLMFSNSLTMTFKSDFTWKKQNSS